MSTHRKIGRVHTRPRGLKVLHREVALVLHCQRHRCQREATSNPHQFLRVFYIPSNKSRSSSWSSDRSQIRRNCCEVDVALINSPVKNYATLPFQHENSPTPWIRIYLCDSAKTNIEVLQLQRLVTLDTSWSTRLWNRTHPQWQKRLLSKENLKYDSAVKLLVSMETAEHVVRNLGGKPKPLSNQVSQPKRYRGKPQQHHKTNNFKVRAFLIILAQWLKSKTSIFWAATGAVLLTLTPLVPSKTLYATIATRKATLLQLVERKKDNRAARRSYS